MNLNKAPRGLLTDERNEPKIHVNGSASGSIRRFAGGVKRVSRVVTSLLGETSFYLEIACRLRLFQGKRWFSSNQ